MIYKKRYEYIKNNFIIITITEKTHYYLYSYISYSIVCSTKDTLFLFFAVRSAEIIFG